MSTRPLPDPDPDTTTLALAHALRTPLTSLALGLGMLEGETLGPLAPDQRYVVSVLVAEVARLSLLVDRALRTDRLGAYAGPVELHPTDLGALVETAAAPIVAQAGAREVAISRALLPGVVVVADPEKLTWVVASVLGNALRFSPPGAVVDVRLGVAAGEAELLIADQGPGLAPDVQDRLFDRSGGPGLFLAREIVEALGGTIHASSEPGGGCTFTIRLPLFAGRAREKGPRDEQEG